MSKGLDISVSVMGVKETLRVLKNVDEDLYWESIRQIKEAAEPISEAMEANFPDEGPRGFRHNGRTGWSEQQPIVVQYGGKRSGTFRRNGVWPLVRIKVVDAPRQIFDMAGAKTPGNKLDRGLQKGGYGAASRAVWRVSETARKAANRQLVEAMREVSAKANRKLTVLRPGA